MYVSFCIVVAGVGGGGELVIGTGHALWLAESHFSPTKD